ncbi:MAG: DUF433 domain-containing protein [Rubrivivax sp.]|nr:DUF433 domain-containing protein [Rubrivivax sp.]
MLGLELRALRRGQAGRRALVRAWAWPRASALELGQAGRRGAAGALKLGQAGRRGDGDEEAMIDLPRRQLVFSEIIRPSLYAGIEYEGMHARRWYPMGEGRRAVVLDPAVQFGSPIVAHAGIPTDIIHAAYLAEGRDRSAVARIFKIEPRDVDAAVKFESKLAA